MSRNCASLSKGGIDKSGVHEMKKAALIGFPMGGSLTRGVLTHVGEPDLSRRASLFWESSLSRQYDERRTEAAAAGYRRVPRFHAFVMTTPCLFGMRSSLPTPETDVNRI